MKKYLLIAFMFALLIMPQMVYAINRECAVHIYPDDWTIVKEPTETEVGIKIRQCKHCGHGQLEEIPMLGDPGHEHEYGEWRITREPTSTNEGLKERTCSVCGAIDVEPVPVNPFANPGSHVHVYGEWKTTRAPTATTEGEQMRVCTVAGCFVTEKKSIPATGNSSVTVVDPGLNQNLVITDIKNKAKDIWATVVVLVQIASVACIVFAGLRYMFAAADQKADIKQGLIFLTLGAILVFCTTLIIQLVVGAAQQIM